MQIVVPAGVNILAFLRDKGIAMPAHCGGAGVCGKCIVRLLAGRLDVTKADRGLLSENQLNEGLRLACKAVTASPVRIEIPERGKYQTADSLWESADSSHVFGIACDIGTTTIAMSLVDITAKRAVRTVSLSNSQSAYGADVLTRITSGQTAALKRAVAADIERAIAELDCGGLNVTKMMIAANTAMYHFLLGLDAACFGKSPFEPMTLGGERMPLSELLGKAVDRDIPVTLIKGISAFIGGDIVSGLALLGKQDNTLFLDLGTNGEMALFTENGILCASAAAGPALEGGELSCGMGGVRGAISRIYDGGDGFSFDTVENAPPTGICGSGAVDAYSYCLRHGLMDNKGTFSDSYIDTGFRLCDNVTLTQQDIRELQLAKAAIRAALDTLLLKAGKGYDDIDELLIAGGFGHFLDIESACTIGLIPRALKEKAKAVGNTSLKGAQAALYDEGFFERAEEIAANAKTLTLSDDEQFKKHFIECIDSEEF